MMEHWKRPERKRASGSPRFRELMEKERSYTITDEEAVELADLRRRGRLTAAHNRDERKRAEQVAIEADINEANDDAFAEMRKKERRKERASQLRKTWLEGTPREGVNEDGDVVPYDDLERHLDN